MENLKKAIIGEMTPYISSGTKKIKFNQQRRSQTFKKDSSFDVVKQYWDDEVQFSDDLQDLQTQNPSAEWPGDTCNFVFHLHGIGFESLTDFFNSNIKLICKTW